MSNFSGTVGDDGMKDRNAWVVDGKEESWQKELATDGLLLRFSHSFEVQIVQIPMRSFLVDVAFALLSYLLPLLRRMLAFVRCSFHPLPMLYCLSLQSTIVH